MWLKGETQREREGGGGGVQRDGREEGEETNKRES